MLKTFSLSRNDKLKKNLGIKKNLSYLTGTKSTLNFSNSQYKDTNSKSHISLFIEDNPYHYKYIIPIFTLYCLTYNYLHSGNYLE